MIRRILIICATRIGDTMTCIPAIRALASHYNNSSIIFLGHPKRADVVRHLPYVSRVGYITKNTALFRYLIPSAKYDMAFVFTPEHNLLRYASKSSKVVYTLTENDTYESSNITYIHDNSISTPMHLIDRFLQIPRHLGIRTESRKLDYKIHSKEEEFIEKFYNTHSLNNYIPLITIQSSSFHTKDYRNWPIENFCRLCNSLLLIHPNSFFILLGSRDDKNRNSIIKKELGSHALDTSGKLGLRQAGALIGKCSLYIGVDTGPSHIAGALNTPSVVMYHANCPSNLIAPPETSNFTAIEHPLTGTASAITADMKDITVESVLQKCLEMLSIHECNPI